MKLAARMKFPMAAGNVAAAAAASVSSTSDGPLPAQPSPSQQDPAGKAPAPPAAKPPASSAISMTAALKNVGAVSIHLIFIYPTPKHGFSVLCRPFCILCLADNSCKRNRSRTRVRCQCPGRGLTHACKGIQLKSEKL